MEEISEQEMGISVKVWHGCGERFRFFGDRNFVGKGFSLGRRRLGVCAAKDWCACGEGFQFLGDGNFVGEG